MGRYLGKCKKVVGEIAVVGVKTRARAALAMAAETASATTSPPRKKIKKVTKSSSYNIPQLRNRRKNLSSEEVANCSSNSEVITAITRSDFPASCCSSNKDDGLGTSVADPEVDESESGEESSKRLECEITEAREACTKPNEQESPVTKSTAEIKMPSDSEIEEFFAVAEKDIQKRFTDKYNYDIVKDVPLSGRYEWVPIKP